MKYRALLAMVMLVMACDSTGAPLPPPPPPPPPTSVAGSWDFSWVVTEATGDCASELGETTTAVITIAQSGSTTPFNLALSGFHGDDDNELFGFLSSNGVVTFHGALPEDGGTTNSIYELQWDGEDEMTGSESWSWTHESGACPGSESSVAATRR